MPSVGVKLYSVYFKFLLKHRLQNRMQNPHALDESSSSFGVTSRPDEESIAPSNPSFTDGVATKDIHIDPLTSLSVRIFLPDTCLASADTDFKSQPNKSRAKDNRGLGRKPNFDSGSDANQVLLRRNSFGSSNGGITPRGENIHNQSSRRNSYGFSPDDASVKSENGVYGGYNPAKNNCRRVPVMLQFHGGGFVSGSNDSVANDLFCRRIAKVCDVIVLAVGYRLAPENRYPAAFEDGLKVLHWLAKQANLAECSKSLGNTRANNGTDLRKSDVQRSVADAFGASMVEPWLAAHGDPSR